MNKLKKSIFIIIIIIIAILVLVSIFWMINYFSEKDKIKNVYDTYTDDYIQNKVEIQNTTTSDDLMLEIDGEKVLGIIKIDKINFEGLVYEGTSLSTLSKGVGHLSNSPYFNGNNSLTLLRKLKTSRGAIPSKLNQYISRHRLIIGSPVLLVSTASFMSKILQISFKRLSLGIILSFSYCAIRIAAVLSLNPSKIPNSF